MRDRILAVLRSIRPKPIAILRFLELSLEGICAIPGYATWAVRFPAGIAGGRFELPTSGL